MEAALEAGHRRRGVKVVRQADHGRVEGAAVEELPVVGENSEPRRRVTARVAELGVGLGDGGELDAVEASENG